MSAMGIDAGSSSFEYVPKRLIAWIARGLYNEPYVATPMSSRWSEQSQGHTIRHELVLRGGTHSLEMTISQETETPSQNTLDHFFKEHSWGFGQTRQGKLLQYQVWHPVWETRPVQRLSLDWDFQKSTVRNGRTCRLPSLSTRLSQWVQTFASTQRPASLDGISIPERPSLAARDQPIVSTL